VDLSDARWHISSFSGGNGNTCVEVAFLPGETVALRDTKDREIAAHRYPTADWHTFLAGVRAGEFARR
jgi:hypothetical protein